MGNNKAVSTEILTYYDNKTKDRMEQADLATLNSAKTYANDLKNSIEENFNSEVGNLEDLDTSSKNNLVEAINEIKNSVSEEGVSSTITISTEITTSGALKSYTVKQGSKIIGTIDIPKDMVVTSGSVVTNPTGQPAGTYIKLILANVTEPLYINVGTLVDIYKVKESATQVQISIDSSTRVISATIVAGSVTATELASNSVTTAKISDGNVTKAKLATSVQTSLNKADSAVQNVSEGSSNGTVSVDGVNVPVKGLGSAAYAATSAFDSAGSASAVDGKLTTEVSRAKAAEAKALADAKTYVDAEIKKIDLSGISVNNQNISILADSMIEEQEKSEDFETRIAAEEAKTANFENRIKSLENMEWATEADIDALFEN